MPTICKITLDAEEYKRQLAEAVEQSRAAAAKIADAGGGGAPNLKVEVDTPSVVAAKKAVQELADSSNSFGANAKKNFGSLRDQLIGGSKALAQMKNGILSLLNPWSLIVAAVGVVVSVCTKLYDMLTVSAEEFGQKAAAAAELARQHTAKLNEQAAAADQYIRRLEELNSAESSSNDSRRETLQLVAQLESYYGKLGAVIDSTTGKISNMDEVEERVRTARARRMAEATKTEMEAVLRQGRAEYMKWRGSGAFTTEAAAGREWDDLTKRKSWRGLAEYSEKEAQKATTSEDVAAMSKIAGYLRQAEELREKYNNLETNGYKTPEEKLAAEQEKHKEYQRLSADAAAAKKQRLEHERSGAIGDQKDPAKRREMLEADLRREQDKAAKLRAEAAKLRSADGYTNANAAALAAEKKYQESLLKQYEIQRQIVATKKQEADFNRSLADQAKELAARAAEATGQGRAFAEQRALEMAKRRKRGELSDGEADAVKHLATLEYDLSHDYSRKPAGADLSIQSDALTKRGGFKSGAVVPDADRWSQLNNELQKKSVSRLDEIKKLVQKITPKDSNNDPGN